MKRKNDIFASIIAHTFPAIFTFLYFVVITQGLFAQIFYGFSRIFLITLPFVWIVLIDKKKFSFVKFKKNGLWTGSFVGLAIGAGIVVVYFAFLRDVLDFSQVKMKAEQLKFSNQYFILFAIFLTFFNSSIEEYYWRWFGFTKMKNILPKSSVYLLNAVGFATHHVILMLVFFEIGVGIILGVGVFVGGLIFSYLFDRFESTFPGWITHLLIDAALMIIGYDILFLS